MEFFHSADVYNNYPIDSTDVRASKKAEVFSEAYFRSLYKRKLRKHLQSNWEDSEEAFNQKWPEEFKVPPEEFACADDYEKAKEEYIKKRAEEWDDWQPEPWNEEEERRRFEQIHQLCLHYVRRDIPTEILNRVADLRVLALDVAAPDVKRDIVKLCRENERKEKKWAQEMGAHYRNMVKKYPESFIDKLHLHDGRFTGFEWQDGNLVFGMDDECITHLYCSRVVFVDCEILQMQEDLIGSEWLYEEVHEDGNGFIVHVLTYNRGRERDHQHDELTLRCRDVILEPGSPKDYD